MRTHIKRYIDPVPKYRYFVAPSGNNSNDGRSPREAWLTMQYAADTMPANCNAVVLPGTYAETPITFSHDNQRFFAQGPASITGRLNISGDYNILNGFKITAPADYVAIQTTGDGNLIENNDISNTLEDGFNLFGSNNIIRRNYIHDLTTDVDAHSDFFYTSGPLSNFIFERNLCVSLETTGIRQICMIESPGGVVDSLTIRNNIFVMAIPGDSRMSIHRHVETGEQVISNITIVNNTFYHVAAVWQDMGRECVWVGDITTLVAKNNLIVNYGDSTHGYYLSHGTTSADVDYNCVYKITGSDPMGGPFAHDVWMIDPEVVSLASRDFHLQTTSPCKNVGATGLGALADYDGVVRDATPDIGAYEFV